MSQTRTPLFSRGTWIALIGLTLASLLVFVACLTLALLQLRFRGDGPGPARPADVPTRTAGPPSAVPTSALPPTLTPTASPTPVPTGPPSLAGLTGRIAFTCTRKLYNHICLINADGSGLIQLTDGEVNDYYPALGVDDYVYFASQRTPPFTIYRVPAAGGQPERVVTEGGLGEMSAPELSPDGAWVVFAAGSDRGVKQILRVRRDGGGLLYLVGDGRNLDPTWSPDGTRIAYAALVDGEVHLFVMDADGDNRRRVTAGGPPIGGRSSWSPDGTRLAYYAGPAGDKDIYVVEVATGQITRLTYGGNNTGPSFSPDGQWIVFASSRDGDFDLYVMRPDGSDVRQLTFNSGVDDWQPRWAR